MTAENNVHGKVVEGWLSGTVEGLSSAELIELFERGFGAMWARAHATLGDVTLTAIVDRVLFDAAERYPALSLVDVGPTGLRFDRLRAAAGDLDAALVRAAIEAVLHEFLRVLGSLTAEILSPALHAALTAVGRTDAERTEPEDVTS